MYLHINVFNCLEYKTADRQENRGRTGRTLEQAELIPNEEFFQTVSRERCYAIFGIENRRASHHLVSRRVTESRNVTLCAAFYKPGVSNR